MSKLITIEGNLHQVNQHLVNSLDESIIEVLTEPLEKWKNWKGRNLGEARNLLELMYYPKKYQEEFQLMVQETLLDNHNYVSSKPIKVIERSLYSCQ
jgi:hypothetical protein